MYNTLKNCYSCGNAIGDSKFCSHCGASQECSSCGTEITSPSKFCSKCGASIGQTVNTQATTITPSTSPKKSFDFKKIPWFVWAIAAAVILLLIFNPFKGPNTPKEVVTEFMEAFEDLDEKRIKKLIHPDERDIVDFSGVPKDVKVKIIEFEEVTIEGDEAYVVVIAEMSSKKLGLSEEDDFEFELEKVKGKWLIVDGL